MYIVTIHNDEVETPIHNEKEKLDSGKIVKGINTIDSFTLSMLPNNAGFAKINECTTLVKAYNANRSRYDFIGRVLYAETSMDESGIIAKNVTCESVAGYLCDSVQTYVEEKNWTVSELLNHLITCHNSQVEDYKKFKIGTVTASDKNDNLYLGIQRDNTWDAIKAKLIDKIGGELQFRVEDDGIYIDYLEQIGEQKDTEIALAVNMKAITVERDPTDFITRLIPLGCKLTEEIEKTDEEGNTTTETVETEERLDITSVNGGLNYVDDEDAVAAYGIHVGVVEWDDVTTAAALLVKGKAWLIENNKVRVKYSITALDLSLIGLALDDFNVGNTHPVENGLIGIADTVRIVKKSIDICNEVESAIEIGDNIQTLSDVQRDLYAELKAAYENLEKFKTNTTNVQSGFSSDLKNVNSRCDNLNKKTDAIDEKFTAKTDEIVESVKEVDEKFTTKIEQLEDSITLEVSGSLGSKASIILSCGDNEYTGEMDLEQVRKAFADDPTAISISAGTITFNAGTIIINSLNFSVTADGIITATGGTIGAITLSETGIYSCNESFNGSHAGWYRPETIKTSETCFFAGATDETGENAGFYVTYGGTLFASDAHISGEITTVDGLYKTEIANGDITLYYDGVACGTVGTKHFSVDHLGLVFTVEEGGNQISFRHADSSYGTGYCVDYYLNVGFSSNHDYMHVFQTSAIFLDKTEIRQLYNRGMYILENAFIKSCDDEDNVLEEMLGYSSGYVTVGSVGCPTMLRGTTVYLKNTSTTVSSDRNKKNSIEELPEAYETFIDALAPVRYKYNEGNSGRYHVGYIAQEVEAALIAAGLTTADFAGYVNINGSGELGLAYDEFIALLHQKIKRLESRISELESVNT